MNIQNLVLDINKKCNQLVTANVGEVNSRLLKISVIDNGVPMDLTGITVYLYAKKADGTKVFNTVKVEDAKQGIVSVEITSQVLAIEGFVKLTLLLTKDKARLASKIFTLKVDETIVDDEALESSNEFKALDLALDKVDKWNGYFEEASGKIEEKYAERLNQVDSQLEHTATNEWCKGGFWNVCHKGGVCSCSPQNSLEGIEKAHEFGYKAIEVDVTITSDGKWICFHDETVDYLTDGIGKCYEKTWEEIRELNYDQTSNQNTTLLNLYYFPVKIPLLEDFLKKANEFNMCVALDIKGHASYTEENIKDLINIIKKYDMENRTAVWGLNYQTVRKYSYHIAISSGATTQTAEQIYSYLKPYGPNILDNRIDANYTKEIINDLHKYGIKCIVGFGGNAEKGTNDVIDKWRSEYGVDYIVADYYLYNEGGR